MRSTIIRAIWGRKLLCFIYDGEPCIVEPYCYGRTIAGEEGLRCYVVGGAGAEPEEEAWRLMPLSKMQSPTLLDDQFWGPRPGYQRGDRGMSSIYCEV